MSRLVLVCLSVRVRLVCVFVYRFVLFVHLFCLYLSLCPSQTIVVAHCPADQSVIPVASSCSSPVIMCLCVQSRQLLQWRWHHPAHHRTTAVVVGRVPSLGVLHVLLRQSSPRGVHVAAVSLLLTVRDAVLAASQADGRCGEREAARH